MPVYLASFHEHKIEEVILKTLKLPPTYQHLILYFLFILCLETEKNKPNIFFK